MLSTGRCGTQWLAATLKGALTGRAVVEHEPLGHDYAVRAMLAARAPEDLDEEDAQPTIEHVAHIEDQLASTTYVECGHPLWSTLPYLVERFRGRVRVIHLVRHPVPTAISWVSHNAFVPPTVPWLGEKVLVSPFDDGVRFPAYRERWSALTPYEKSLYYWAEVNALGLDLERRGDVPWLRVRFEELFRADTVKRIAEFIGFDIAPAIDGANIVDEFRYLATVWTDPGLIARHPELVAVARSLGYDPFDYDEARLRRRYVGV